MFKNHRNPWILLNIVAKFFIEYQGVQKLCLAFSSLLMKWNNFLVSTSKLQEYPISDSVHWPVRHEHLWLSSPRSQSTEEMNALCWTTRSPTSGSCWMIKAARRLYHLSASWFHPPIRTLWTVLPGELRVASGCFRLVKIQIHMHTVT